MANYVKTGPFINGSAPGISMAFLNALENVLEQSSGNTESGKWSLQGQGYTSLANFGNHILSLSRTTVPVSVSIDTLDQAPINSANSPGTRFLGHSGFLVFFTTGGTTTNPQCAGNFTIQF